MGKLTATKIKGIKPTGKKFSVYDGRIDYTEQTRAEKRQAAFDRLNTLAQWSTRWLDVKRKQIKSVSDHEGRLNKWILQKLGSLPLTDIALPDVKALYQHIERYGSAELVKCCQASMHWQSARAQPWV